MCDKAGDCVGEKRCHQSNHSPRKVHQCRLSSRTVFGQNIIISLTAFIFIVSIQGAVEGLTINDLSVPKPVVNGSTPAVILDCVYEYEDHDIKDLVIQWYYNGSNMPFYQWIPPQKPEAMGNFMRWLDLEHRVDDDPYKKHRALRLLRPTVEMSGNYKCKVSSSKSEDENSGNLVIYVPADRLEINKTKSIDGVNVTCVSEGGYPEPLISLVVYRDDDVKGEPVDDFRVVQRDGDGDGHTDVIGFKVFEDRFLASKKVVFECVLAIADADYKETDRFTYYPDIQHVRDGSSVVGSSRLLTVTTAILSTIIAARAAFMFVGHNSFRS